MGVGGKQTSKGVLRSWESADQEGPDSQAPPTSLRDHQEREGRGGFLHRPRVKSSLFTTEHGWWRRGGDTRKHWENEAVVCGEHVASRITVPELASSICHLPAVTNV